MFKIANMRSIAERPFEQYITTDNEAISLGEALILTSGALTKCGATATPEFIAMQATSDEDTISVVRIDENTVLETTFSAAATSIVVGDKLTLASNGLQVTATTTNGVFTVTKILDAGALGTAVQGMFRR